MKYNFDITPNRRSPNLYNKWTYYPKDVLPMWVADMDFPAPQPILKELHKVVDQGVLGYEIPSRALYETVAARMDELYAWKVKPDAIIATPGIVSAFSVAARAFASRQKGVLIQTPVYNEFHSIKNNIGVPQLNVPLIKTVHGNVLRYEIDWFAFERQVKKAGMFLLCNPHNPLGIIFSRKDLLRMAELCIKNNVIIVSDEIHSELFLGGNSFTPIAKLSSEIARHTITLVAPSKTFNVPGLFCGFAIIPNRDLRDRYQKEVSNMSLHVNSIGLQAARIAYSGQCDGWLKELRQYLTGNRDFLVEYVSKHMPSVRMTIPDATYLGWLDFTQTDITGSPFKFFMDQAKVALSDGKIFGPEGDGHVRINFGTSRRLLKQGLDRIRRAMK
ncbi:MAG: pyridoxal phosphate-dependent aminotransferase [Anaerolineales bacterium]|nr:pyridoxal phosphate-dependent aminotransferase [Anaerolineales bacterium]